MNILSEVSQRIFRKPSLVTEDAVRQALRVVIDPDLHKDIVTLGFIKKIAIEGAKVNVVVELTTPACPVKEKLRGECVAAISALVGVQEVQVEMTAAVRKTTRVDHAEKIPTLAGVRNIIAVASGKGGVGKSTTAVNLAYALAAKGARVGILDADIYGPSIPHMTKAPMPTHMDGQAVIPPESGGVKIISVSMFGSADKATTLRGPMVSQIVRSFLQQVAWGELDYLIIDYPPGTGDIQITLSQLAPITGAVIVTTPQDVSLIDVRRAMQMFDTVKIPIIGVIETMSYFICDGCTKKHYIFRSGGGQKLATEHGVPILAEIPMEAIVAATADAGEAIVKAQPDSYAGMAYSYAAGEVARQVAVLTMNDQSGLKGFRLEWRAL